MKYKLTIILPKDMIKREPFGGTLGFVESILPDIKAPVVVYGIGINGTPTWKPFRIGQNAVFIAISQFKYPSHIPMRMKAFFAFMWHRRKIMFSGSDVLYVHSPECALPFLFFNSKMPFIYHQHGSANPLTRSKHVWGRHKILQKAFDFIHFMIHRQAGWNIVIDENSQEQVKQNGVVSKYSLIMNAVNTDKYFPNQRVREEMRRAYSIEKGETVILFVGRLEEAKRVDRLLKAIQQLSIEELKYRLMIVGDGTKKQEIIEFVYRNRLQDVVTLLGRVNSSDLPKYYNMADVLALTSEYEGVPMAILEALACGTPVVATQVGGIASIVTYAQNGIIVPQGDPVQLVTAFKQLASREFDRKSVMKSIDHLSAEHFVKKLEGIVLNLLNRK